MELLTCAPERLFSSWINSNWVALSQHGHLIRHSLTRKPINYHTAVLCRTVQSRTACSHAAVLLERRLIAWRLSPARCIWLATRQRRSAAITTNSTGFIKQGTTDGSQLAFLNRLFSSVIFIRLLSSAASHPRTHLTCFLISIIKLNLRLFSIAHHRCRITIARPTYQRR